MPTPVRRIGSVTFIAFGVVAAIATWYTAGKLATSDRRAFQITNNAPAGIAMCNAKGQIVYANPSLCEMTGYTRDELLSGGVNLIIPDQYREQHHTALDNAYARWQSGEVPTGKQLSARVMPVRCKDGSTFDATVRLSTISKDRNVEFIAYVTRRLPDALPMAESK